MESRNVAAARGVILGFAREDIDGAASFFAEDGVLVSPSGGGAIRGRAAIKEHMRRSLATFSEWQVEDLEFIDAGDVVVALMTSSATQVGPLGDAPATGKRIRIKFCEVYRFNSAGEVILDEAFYDLLAAYRQLGLV